MKNQLTKKNDYQIRNDQNFIIENKNIKTTNINVLLNRVRLEKKKKSKKIIIYSALIICMLSFISIILSNSSLI